MSARLTNAIAALLLVCGIAAPALAATDVVARGLAVQAKAGALPLTGGTLSGDLRIGAANGNATILTGGAGVSMAASTGTTYLTRSGVAPNLGFLRSDITALAPATSVGNLQFTGPNGAASALTLYASIVGMAVSTTSGSEAGSLQMRVVTGGTANTLIGTFGSTGLALGSLGLTAGSVSTASLVATGAQTVKVRRITSGLTDTATSTDYDILWRSATAGSKTETIPACSSGNIGQMLKIKDAIGTAGTNAITVVPASGTIEGVGTYVINTNRAYATFHCDGAVADWLVM